MDSGVNINEGDGLYAVGNLCYFETTGAGSGLWVSDGTSSGTSEIDTGVSFTHPVAFDGELYSIASGSLYKSDGTLAGTVNISSSAGIDDTQALAVADGTLFFDADYDGEHSGPYVWYSLTPTSGPQVVSTGDYLNSPPMLTDVNGSLYFDGSNDSTGDSGVYLMSAVTTTTDLYYSNQQQVLEQRQGGTVTDQYVWSPFYVNDLILRDDNSTSGSLGISGSGLGQRLYAQHDANYNVTALVNTDSTVAERFIYDPYGNVTVLNADWSASTATAGEDSYHWAILFQGERFDPTAGVYVPDERVYSPTMQRWITPDPDQYIDGANEYQMEEDDVTGLRDPEGTDSSKDTYNQGSHVLYTASGVKIGQLGTGTITVAAGSTFQQQSISFNDAITFDIKMDKDKNCIDAHWVQFATRVAYDEKGNEIDKNLTFPHRLLDIDRKQITEVDVHWGESFADSGFLTTQRMGGQARPGSTTNHNGPELVDGDEPGSKKPANAASERFVADTYLIVNSNGGDSVIFHYHWELLWANNGAHYENTKVESVNDYTKTPNLPMGTDKNGPFTVPNPVKFPPSTSGPASTSAPATKP